MRMRRLGLLGGESTGKTTLARALAEALPGRVAPEHLRDFVAATGRAPLRDEQPGIFAAQREAVEDAVRAGESGGAGWVIADPLPLMTAVYSLVYFDDPSLMQEGLDDARAYDLILWCAPDIPWEADSAMRDGISFRDRADNVIETVIAPVLPLQRIAGSETARLAQALNLADIR